jgi:hypothetical protein
MRDEYHSASKQDSQGVRPLSRHVAAERGVERGAVGHRPFIATLAQNPDLAVADVGEPEASRLAQSDPGVEEDRSTMPRRGRRCREEVGHLVGVETISSVGPGSPTLSTAPSPHALPDSVSAPEFLAEFGICRSKSGARSMTSTAVVTRAQASGSKRP